MQNKIYLIGHSQYPNGIKSALKFIANLEENIITLALDNDFSIDLLENNLVKSLKPENFNLVFADLPGGSPHQGAVKIMQQQKLTNTIIIAGAGLGLILDLALKTLLLKTTNLNELKKQIKAQMNKLNNFTLINELET